MNEATDTAGLIASGLWYFVGVSIGVVVIITALTIVSYLCAPPHYTGVNALHRSVDAADVPGPGIGDGEARILSCPRLLFCEATRKGSHHSRAATCCSICLSDYKDADTVRVLPDCGHLFHLQCVDPWLTMHPTCPNCRTSPLSTPLPPSSPNTPS